MNINDLDPKDIEVVSAAPAARPLNIRDINPKELEEIRPQETNPLSAVYSGVQNAATLGTAPSIAGLAGGAGGFVGALQSGQGLGNAIDAAKTSFSEARNEAIKKEQDLAELSPVASAIGNVAGTVLTAPLLPAKGLMGAAKVGGLLGLGEATGHAQDLGEAATTIGSGAVSGGLGGLAAKGIQKAGTAAINLAQKFTPTNFLSKVGSTLTGVSKDVIDKYASDVKNIDALSKQVSGDYGEAVSMAKEKIMGDIQNTRKTMSDQISQALGKINPNKTIDASPILNSIQDRIDKLNPKYYSEDINALNALKEKIGSDKGKMNLKDLFDAKQYLQSQSNYMRPGKVFDTSGQYEMAAKDVARNAKNMLNNLSPEIKGANDKLHELHDIEDSMQKSLLNPNKNEGSFLAAGTGANGQDEKALKRIGEITGTDALGTAQQLATSRAFSNPGAIPVDTTGKAVARQALGMLGSGALLAGVSVAHGGSLVDNVQMGLLGAALTSPMALKKVIQSGVYGSDILKSTLKTLDNPQVRSVIAREAGKIGIDTMTLRRRIQKEIPND